MPLSQASDELAQTLEDQEAALFREKQSWNLFPEQSLLNQADLYNPIVLSEKSHVDQDIKRGQMPYFFSPIIRIQRTY